MEDFGIWDPLENYEPFEPMNEPVDDVQIQYETTREKINGFDELVRGLKNRVDLKNL